MFRLSDVKPFYYRTSSSDMSTLTPLKSTRLRRKSLLQPRSTRYEFQQTSFTHCTENLDRFTSLANLFELVKRPSFLVRRHENWLLELIQDLWTD